MTHERSDMGTAFTSDDANDRGEVMPPEAGTWAAAVFVAVGTVLVAAAVVPAVVSGPTNPYAAAGLIVLGLGAIGGGCAVEAYGLVRRYAPAPAAILVAAVAFIPPIVPVFQPGGGDLTFVLVWMALLALATLLVRRSRAAWILAAVTAFPVLGVSVLSVPD